MADFHQQRERLARDIAARGVKDVRVLDAMRAIPREAFVEPYLRPYAYDDGPLPIGGGQTISQPYVVALMAEAAALGPESRALEVGAGCGYAAAVYARIAEKVFAVELDAGLAEDAARRLAALGVGNVALRQGDGAQGWPEEAPFDAILVAAAPTAPPDALRRQLKIGGRLVIPVGGQWKAQRLLKIVRRGDDEFEETRLALVRFVPLR